MKKTVRYIVKVLRKKPHRSYYLTHDCRFCTYNKKLAFRFERFEDALEAIADMAAGADEQPMIVEVAE